jgi:hypothetical protein
MAKKSFTTGIDALLTSTTKEPKPNYPVNSSSEKQTSVMFKMPESLKIKMQHYCIDKQITQQDFIVEAITNHLAQQKT